MQKGQMQFGQGQQNLSGQIGALSTQQNRMAGLAGMQQTPSQMPFMNPQVQQVGLPGIMGPAQSAFSTQAGIYNAEMARPGIGSLLGQVGGAYLGNPGAFRTT